MYREYNLDVYIFNTLKEVDGVDGIIKNIFFDILNLMLNTILEAIRITLTATDKTQLFIRMAKRAGTT